MRSGKKIDLLAKNIFCQEMNPLSKKPSSIMGVFSLKLNFYFFVHVDLFGILNRT